MYVTEVTGTALTAATARTILQLAATTRNVCISEICVSFDGVTASDTPNKVRFVRQSGGATGTSGTVSKRDPSDSDAVTTVKKTVTVEPSTDEVLESFYLTPNGGLFLEQYPEDGRIVVPAGEWFGVEVTSEDGGMNAGCWIAWSES